MTLVGLALIVLAWIIQLKGKKPAVLVKEFLLLYAAGALLLAVDGANSSLWAMSLLNATTAMLVLLVLKRQKK